MKKSIYLIPNAVTTANVVCGFASILASIKGNFQYAAWAIIAAGIFDLFDGRIARWLKASSAFGGEYDTLSDLLSFGVAPAVLFYQASFQSLGALGAILSLFYLLCVMFRLARFAVAAGQPSNQYFQGLSSPVSAATASAFILFCSNAPMDSTPANRSAAAVAVSLGALMVSHLRFPSFKQMNWKSPSGIFLLASLMGLVAFTLVDPRFRLFPVMAVLLLVVVLLDIASRIKSSSDFHETPVSH